MLFFFACICNNRCRKRDEGRVSATEKLREKAKGLPLVPGVYLMLDKDGDVIYVGKAKQLRNRVSSYFQGAHNVKTEAMVEKVADFEVIMAGSEFEALVLENSLIKHHMPKYNILLKDGKGYPFIRIDMKKEYPTFEVVSKIANDGAKYFGPYGGRGNSFRAIEAVSKALLLPTCGKVFPRDIGKERPCLNYHIGACAGYCRKDASSSEYLESIETAIHVLDGRTAEIKRRLKAEMEDAAENLRFEKAAERRDKLKAMELLENRQYVISGALADTDAVGFYRGVAKSCFAVLHYIGGELLDKDFELLETPLEEDDDAVAGILMRYYERRGVLPKNILLPVELPEAELLEQMFTEKSGKRVYIHSPQRGDKQRLVETANINAREETERATSYEEKTLKSLEWLKKELNLPDIPERIEAYDISNTGSSDMVASMIVFKHGRPLKRDYRRFKIKTLETQDDYHSMMEVVARRVIRYLDGDEKFAPLPNLILADGGAAHARAVTDALEGAGLSIPVFGMVKDDRHHTRALMSIDGDEIGIVANPAVFTMIGTIQEEVHRFAITYHRTLRSKSSYKSQLESIPGVGEKRRAELLRHFRSIKNIKAASAEELSAVVPRNTAEAVYAFFHSKREGEANEGN